MRFHLPDKFKFMRKHKMKFRMNGEKIIIIIYGKAIFNIVLKSIQHPVAAAAGAKNVSTVMLDVCVLFGPMFAINACVCVRVFVLGVRPYRMYNSYQIHSVVVVVIYRKFIRIWFDEQAR